MGEVQSRAINFDFQIINPIDVIEGLVWLFIKKFNPALSLKNANYPAGSKLDQLRGIFGILEEALPESLEVACKLR